MKQVKLTGKTRKGKTRIGTHGALWNVVEGAAEALTPFRENCILLTSMNGRDWRWVDVKNDENFTVEFL
jgi:hypothetical protein